MTKPFFSIVIPTLNEESSLPKLLSDLSLQTFKNFEVIIVDGNSEDKTIIKSKYYSKHFILLTIITSKTRNVSTQRNRGGKIAIGKYIVFMDADIRIPVNFLEKLEIRIFKKPADLFSTWCKPDLKLPAEIIITQLTNLALGVRKLLKIPGALGCLIGCKQEIFKKTGMFDPKIHFGEDSKYVLDASRKGFKFRLYTNPKYTHSYRRFRKRGYFNETSTYLKNRIKIIIAEDKTKVKINYPMGGHVH